MKKLRSFIKTSLIGGLVVILPVTILVTVFLWLYTLITNWIAPLSTFLRTYSEYNELIANFIAISLVIAACFFCRRACAHPSWRIPVQVHREPGSEGGTRVFHDQGDRAAGFRQPG